MYAKQAHKIYHKNTDVLLNNHILVGIFSQTLNIKKSITKFFTIKVFIRAIQCMASIHHYSILELL